MSDDEFKRAMELQRRAFEAQFGSLEEMGFEDKTKKENDSDLESSTTASISDVHDSDNEEQEFSGKDYSGSSDANSDFNIDSDDEFAKEYEEIKQSEKQTNQPKVIKFTDSTRPYEEPSKKDLKLLRSGKAPSTIRDKLKKEPKKKAQQPLTAKDEEDVHNDLELQRFLQESHILSNFQEENSGAGITLKTIEGVDSADSSASGPIGKSRRFMLDSRLNTISATNKVAKKKLEKMPMSMRKGMVQSRKNKIAKFEQEAKDGGIILSKIKKGELRNIGGSLSISDRIGTGQKKKSTFREKGLKINSVGRSTRNGLVISQKDIDRINGKGDQFKGKGSKGRKRR